MDIETHADLDDGFGLDEIVYSSSNLSQEGGSFVCFFDRYKIKFKVIDLNEVRPSLDKKCKFIVLGQGKYFFDNNGLCLGADFDNPNALNISVLEKCLSDFSKINFLNESTFSNESIGKYVDNNIGWAMLQEELDTIYDI